MNHKSIPPFYVGQEIVAVRNHSEGLYKKGKKYIVMAIRKTCSCYWDISIGISTQRQFCLCPICGKDNIPTEGIQWHQHIAFAPITSTFQTIEYTEVLELEKPMVGAN